MSDRDNPSMADRKPPSPAAPSFSGDRATAPMALEEDTPSAWARFEELQKAHEAGFQHTQPATRPQAPATNFAATEPMALPGTGSVPQQRPATGRKASMDEALIIARRNNRACPVPAQWAALHRLLPVRTAEGRTFAAPPPVDGAAWGSTSAMQKRLRLRDQIEWADRSGALQPVFEFLLALPEDQWHHFGD